MENIWLQPMVDNYKKFFGDVADVVIDIGTRDGDDAEFLREKLSAGRVIAIDANPAAVEKTKANYPEFVVVHTAVSDVSGETKFYKIDSGDKDMDGCSSIYSDKIVNEIVFQGKYEVIDVQVTRMDALLRKVGLWGSIVDVVKVDIEGFTYECILGFGRLVGNVKMFHLETEKNGSHPGHKGNVAVARLMRELGFALVDLSYEWGPNVQDQVWINRNLANPDVLNEFSELKEK
jgi:FkbM family methyltransferase